MKKPLRERRPKQHARATTAACQGAGAKSIYRARSFSSTSIFTLTLKGNCPDGRDNQNVKTDRMPGEVLPSREQRVLRQRIA